MSAEPRELSSALAARAESIIRIPRLGMGVRVRVASADLTRLPTVLETTRTAGSGPPLYRRPQSEIFEIMSGRFLFEVDGRRFIARRGDLVSVPGGAARAFVNVTGTGARQKVIIQPAIDALHFFRELALALSGATEADRSELCAFARRWSIEYLGVPLNAADVASRGRRP